MPAPAKRTELINALVERIGARSYLEIGVNKGLNFGAIHCEKKVGVDPKPVNESIVPLTSDEFFAKNPENFDVIFIDGLHEANQVQRDILNSLAVLNDGGFIVCHDMNPWSEQAQRVITPTGKARTGDCWKAFVQLRSTRDDLQMCTVDIDCGCAVIRRGAATPLAVRDAITYRNLSHRRSEWLNLVTSEAFDEWLQGDMRAPLLAQPTPSLWRAVLRACGSATALISLFLVTFLAYFFIESRHGLAIRIDFAVDIVLQMLLSVAASKVVVLLILPLAAAAAVRIGVYAALPRPRQWIGEAITTSAQIFTLLPAFVIGAIVGLTGLAIRNAMDRPMPEVEVVLLWCFVALACMAMLFPTICYATIRAVQSLPRSLREPRFHPALKRETFVRSVVLPNALPRIIAGLGIAFGRVACDVFVVVIWFVSIAAGMYGNSLLLASIMSLGVSVASWWLLRRGVTNRSSNGVHSTP